MIVATDWEDRSPNIVEDQITYPIVTQLLSTAKVKAVRASSFYGQSLVYVIFEDGTDLYWARSRVLEYLSGMAGKLPAGVAPRQFAPLSLGEQIALLSALNGGVLDDMPLDRIEEFRARLRHWLEEEFPEAMSIDDRTKPLSDDFRARLETALVSLARSVMGPAATSKAEE